MDWAKCGTDCIIPRAMIENARGNAVMFRLEIVGGHRHRNRSALKA